jgi:hypothetical protein
VAIDEHTERIPVAAERQLDGLRVTLSWVTGAFRHSHT